MAIAIAFIFVYSNLVLGTCSPIQFRSVSAIIGIFCVLISIAAGYGTALAAGYLMSLAHNLLPFMLLGLGVDDMFVIVTCIDQTPQSWSPEKRFQVGLKHAGPSITITSLTDAIAFFLGSLTTLPALNSFCMYAGFCTIALYISFVTIFSPFFLYDLRRMHKRKSDCCGLCCCKEDTIVCCQGYFLTKRQKEFAEIPQQLDHEEDKTEDYSSRVE